jgi:hypothetical protein
MIGVSIEITWYPVIERPGQFRMDLPEKDSPILANYGGSVSLLA